MSTQLVSLPAHLLVQIASYLPLSSAIPLSTTCSTLCPISETSIWEDLNLSIHRSTPSSWEVPSPPGKAKLRQTRLPNDHRIDLQLSVRHILESRSFGRYVASTLNHLVIRGGARLRSVRKIQFDLDRPIPVELIQLLRSSAPTLRRLELIAPESTFEFGNPASEFTLEAAIAHLHLPFLRLQYLTLPLNSRWEERIRGMLPLTPNLRTLRLVPNVPFSGGWGEASSFPPALILVGWPSLPSLRALEVDQIAESLVGMILGLVQDAPRLVKVALRDPEMVWWPAADDELLHHMSALGLEYLAVTSRCLPAMVASKGFEKLGMLSVEQAPEHANSGRLDNFPLPPLPSLKRVFIHQSHHVNDLSTRKYGGEWSSLPEPIRPIPPALLSQLLGAPNLHLIQFPSSPDNEHTDPDHICETSAGDLHDAVLIRSYHPPDPASEDETFIHCRSYMANHVHLANGLVYRAREVWEEYTDYRGRAVPAYILSRVYTLSGISAAWVEPGRGLKLSEDAWAVVREWYDAECAGVGESGDGADRFLGDELVTGKTGAAMMDAAKDGQGERDPADEQRI